MEGGGVWVRGRGSGRGGRKGLGKGWEGGDRRWRSGAAKRDKQGKIELQGSGHEPIPAAGRTGTVVGSIPPCPAQRNVSHNTIALIDLHGFQVGGK